MPQKLVLKGKDPSKFIVLGEDDEDDQEMLTEIFSSIDQSYSLLFVNNGKEILNTLKNMEQGPKPCLLILDYNLPALNGAEILRELRKYNGFNTVPKIIWSTSDSPAFQETCLSLGATEYIIKPSTTAELERIARYMLSFCK